MSRVTSKLQVTVPKAIADQYGIRPGDDIEWIPAGDSIRVVPVARRGPAARAASPLALFDAATKRERKRAARGPTAPARAGRGWRREDLYERGRTD